MAYIGGIYRVWVYGGDDESVSFRMIDYIKTEREARAVANAEWVKPDTKSVKITLNGFDNHKRRKVTIIAAAIKRQYRLYGDGGKETS